MLGSLQATWMLAQTAIRQTSQGASDALASGQEAVNPGGAASPGGGLDTIVLFGVMLLVFYFLLIRPQQKRSKEHKVLVSGLKRGDEVMTNSGIYGRIQQIDGEVALVEIAKNVQIRILKSQIAGHQSVDTEGGKQKDAETVRKANPS